MAPLDLLPDEQTTVRDLGRDGRLFHQGDPASAVYRVESGRVCLERRTYDGRLVTVCTARPGDLLAEASLFAQTYHCDARAVLPARVRVYPKAALLRAMRGCPATSEVLLRVLARQVQTLRLQVELRSVRSATDRLLLFLQLKADPASGLLTLDHPLQDIAADLGLSREAVYRAFPALERQGAIARSGKTVRLSRRD